MFNKLNITMFTFIVYHSQTDDQNEQITQIIEIILRFHIIAASKNE